MSTTALNFVKQWRRAGGFAQAVLIYLAETMNEETGLCCPSRESIAEFFSAPDDPCTVKRVERALAKLRALGFIQTTRKPYRKETQRGVEGGWHNVYELPGLAEFAASGVAPKSTVTPKTGVTPTVSGGSPHGGQGVAPMVSGGSPHGGGTNQKVTRREPEEEPEGGARDFPPAISDDELNSLLAEAVPHDEACLFPEELPPAKPKRSPSASKRGTRLTLDALPAEWAEWLKREAPDIDPDKAWADFHDYWVAVPGARGLKLDWLATFRNAIRSIPEWKRESLSKTVVKKKNRDDYLPNSRFKRQECRDYSKGAF